MSDTAIQEYEQKQVEALAVLPREMAIVKMENDNIMALAAAHPRSHAKVLADIKEQIVAYPSFTRTAIYAKPVGKDQTGQMKFARGLSVRAAEALSEAYGYNRVRTDVTPIDPNTVRVEATFVDYQRGRVWQDAGIVSKTYRRRDGSLARHADDRFYNVVVKAEASRRIRECIIRSIPPGLRSELYTLIDEQIDSYLDDSTVMKIVSNFANKGVVVEQLEAMVGRSQAGWTKADRVTLLEAWNALETEETTIEELFGGKARAQTPADGKTATEKLAEEISNQGTAKAHDSDAPAPVAPATAGIATAPAAPEPVESEAAAPALPGPDGTTGAPQPPPVDGLGHKSVPWLAKNIEDLNVGDEFATEGKIAKVTAFSKFHVIRLVDGESSLEVKRWTQKDPPEWCAVGEVVTLPLALAEYRERRQFKVKE